MPGWFVTYQLPVCRVAGILTEAEPCEAQFLTGKIL
jgi:hypothetical protein